MKDVELKLISELMKNSRRSDRELAKAVRVSQPTVSRMIKKLEREGVIKEYTMIPDFRKLGYEVMAITFVKLKRALSSQEIEEARGVAKGSLKKGPCEIVMLERGLGLGYDGVIISFHENYAAYVGLRQWLGRFEFLEFAAVEGFLISLSDKVRYRALTFSAVAKHLLTLKQRESSVEE
jgi:DNA-binding Lrp family transcriptional regulator